MKLLEWDNWVSKNKTLGKLFLDLKQPQKERKFSQEHGHSKESDIPTDVSANTKHDFVCVEINKLLESMSLKHMLLLSSGPLFDFFLSLLLSLIFPQDKLTIQTHSYKPKLRHQHLSNFQKGLNRIQTTTTMFYSKTKTSMVVETHRLPGLKLWNVCLNPEDFNQAKLILASSFIKIWLFCDLRMIDFYVGHDVAKIDSMISDLGTEFLLTVEEDSTSFLGIQKSRHSQIKLSYLRRLAWPIGSSRRAEWHIVMPRILLLYLTTLTLNVI